MKVVIDTNVLVSSFWKPDSAVASILKSVLKYDIVLCYSEEIINEYKEVLQRPKFNFDAQEINDLFDAIERKGEFVIPERLDIDFIDEDDKPFYEIAKYLNIPLVTGNLKHYPDDAVAISPTDFLNNYNF